MSELRIKIVEKTSVVTKSLLALGNKKYATILSDRTSHKYDSCWKIYGYHIYELFSFMVKYFEEIFYSHNLKLLKNMYSFSTDCIEHYFVIPSGIKCEKITKTYMQICLEKTKKYRDLYTSEKKSELILKIYKSLGLPKHVPFEIKMIIIQFLYK